jgi:hypothetical protein
VQGLPLGGGELGEGLGLQGSGGGGALRQQLAAVLGQLPGPELTHRSRGERIRVTGDRRPPQ